MLIIIYIYIIHYIGEIMDISEKKNSNTNSTVATKSVNNGLISTPVIVQGDVFQRLVNAQRRTQKEMSTHIKNFTAVSGGPQGTNIENFVYGDELEKIDNISPINDIEDDDIQSEDFDGNLVTFHERENFALQQENLEPSIIKHRQELPSEELVEREAKSLYTQINKKPVDSLVELLNARLPKNQITHPIKL